MRSIALVASSLIGPALLATPALASPPGTHSGLMLRFGAGFGYDVAGDSADEGSVTIGGLSGALEVAVGGYVAPKLAIHGELWLSATPNPEVTVELDGFGSASGEAEGTMAFFGAGAGVTFWIGNIDLYLSGTLGLSKAAFAPEGESLDDFDTDWGLAGKFSVGKQWYVSRDWGVGVSGALTIASLQDDDADESAAFVAFHVLFTATFH